MLAKIKPIENKDIIINYNMQKVFEKKGEILANNLFFSPRTAGEIKEIFNQIEALNDKVDKNKSIQFMLSLSDNDRADNEKLDEFSKEYISKMGYENCPWISFVHNDTDHKHVHIITSTINYDGEKVKEWDNFNKSRELVKDLCLKYNLEYAKKEKGQNIPLNEINKEKYSIQNAIKKGFRSYHSQKELLTIVGEGKKDEILRKPLSNKELIEKLGEQKYKEILEFLNSKKLFNELYKENLIKRLNSIIESNPSSKEYFDLLRKEGIYCRKLSDKNRNYLMYGIEGFYIKDGNLPGRFRYENIVKGRVGEGQYINKEKQKAQIWEILKKAKENSSSFEDFRYFLRENSVELISYENQRGIYGLSYKLNSENSLVIKGSEFSDEFTWKGIKNEFNIKGKEEITDIYIPKEQDQIIEAADLVQRSFHQGKTEDEFMDDLKRKRKKKKKKNRDINN